MIDYINLELFNQSSIRKDIDIAYDTNKHITNNDVVSGSFSLDESAYSSKELKFGSLVSSKMSVKLYNTVDNLIDKELSVSLTINKDNDNPFKIGKYIVKSDKPTSDRLYKQIEAYDGLYDVIHKNVADWYESLSFPLTQKVFRDSFFNYVGLEQVETTLINDNILLHKTVATNSLSGKTVLSAICELNGAIGRINRDGKFDYIILEPNPADRITVKNIESKSGSYEDYECKPITKVQIRQDVNDIGSIVGTDGNTYIVQDNFLAYGKSSTELTDIATNLLSVIRGITYRPFKVKAIYGNPCYEIGDAITVVTRNATFNSYIFNRTLKGIQSMSDTIKADGIELYTQNVNGSNIQFQQLKRQTNELERTVEQTKSTISSVQNEVTDLGMRVDEAESNITQTAESIISEVEKNYTAKSDSLSSVKVYYALSDSNTIPPEKGWSISAPEWTENKYMWQKTVEEKADGTISESNPTCIQGAKGKDAAIQSATEPSDKTYMWLDTSQNPPVLKNYDSETESWVVVSDMSEINLAIIASETKTSSQIEQTSNNIISSVKENYYAKAETDLLLSSMQTQFEQTASGFEMQFNRVSADLNDILNGTDAQFQQISKYIRFENGNIILGESNNALILKIQNDRISFVHNNNEVAYFTNQKLYVKDGEFINSLQLGKFAFLPRSSGNLSFKKIIN